ncbi:biotin/lipoyl-containing protein [Brachyspira aalborgi]|jgi:pyruvate carboxylase subunit B|uniref:Biotin attachment protein n=1 Tax=Brachyspira aalborgi TaxID=29522 RepID=A0ABY3KCA3_9SPIR|nr:biotin/lipoyl-containing protein [Brachyspira aalborgi]TXJ34049.1 biotin attachment protein [Brachyspira aalborgi]TXJ43650.1 biotin attachment protein [Brachyspira aalborgi]CCY77450.1 biotin/lipoyl attachment domain-containing protein [Brachyspira sp. CAG:700]
MSKKEIKFMITAFRDGFQSVYGARVLSKDFMPAVEAFVNAGVKYFESGGGATFQSAFFYNNENAFDVMDSFRKTVGPDVDLQTLARGVNVVGLESQPREMIKLHADLFKKHGVTTIRNFDALNDVNNLIYSGKCIKEAGLKHQVCVTMMALPPECKGAHDSEFYAKVLKQIMDNVEYDSVCFKDASGTTTPQVVYDTVKEARKLLGSDIRIQVHSHETAGIGALQYKAAIEAGADYIDLSLAPVSGGTCQTDLIVMWHALRGTDYYFDIDIDKIRDAEEVFKDCMKDYFLPPESRTVEPMIPFAPMPGGALTANTQMMRDINVMNRFPEVIKAMTEVVEKGGFGTSVTPVSQFYFQQAFNNVMQGNWKKIADGYGKMVLGYFGKTPTTPDAEIVKIASEQLGLQPTTELAMDIDDKNPKKGRKAAEQSLKDAGINDLSDENVFIAAACKEKGIQFLKGEAKLGIRKNVEESAKATSNEVTITIGGSSYGIKIENGKAIVDGVSYDYSIKDGISQTTSTPTQATSSGAATPVTAGLPGTVVKIVSPVGTQVSDGTTILIVEAMKMEVEIKSSVSGSVKEIKVKPGDSIVAGQELAIVG